MRDYLTQIRRDSWSPTEIEAQTYRILSRSTAHSTVKFYVTAYCEATLVYCITASNKSLCGYVIEKKKK